MRLIIKYNNKDNLGHYILDNIHYVSFLIKIRLINDETDILYQWMY